MPSSIQNPAFSWRVRMKSESAVSATRMTGVAQRDSRGRSPRGLLTLAKAGGTYQRYSSRGRGTGAGSMEEPDPPQSAMFHLYIRGDPKRFDRDGGRARGGSAHLARRAFSSTADPAVAVSELTIGEANLAVTPARGGRALLGARPP